MDSSSLLLWVKRSDKEKSSHFHQSLTITSRTLRQKKKTIVTLILNTGTPPCVTEQPTPAAKINQFHQLRKSVRAGVITNLYRAIDTSVAAVPESFINLNLILKRKIDLGHLWPSGRNEGSLQEGTRAPQSDTQRQIKNEKRTLTTTET